MADTDLVSAFITPVSGSASTLTAKQSIIDSPRSAGFDPSSLSKTDFDRLPCIREKFSNYGLSSSSLEIIMAAWRGSTKKQYTTHIKKWLAYCSGKDCDPVNPPIAIAIDFLASSYHQGLSFSSINTARSALSCFCSLQGHDVVFGQLPLVKRFMKGVFQLRPSLPKHHSIWDVKSVFDFFRLQPKINELSLKDLSHRLAMLLCLLSGQRCQTIQFLNVQHMDIADSMYTFHIIEKLKHTRPGVHQKPLCFLRYDTEPHLCIYTHLSEYLRRTAPFRGEHKQLLLSFVRPHLPVSRDTISRWCRSVLHKSGIDISQYSCHSTRAASTLFLATRHFDLKDIMNAAGWTQEQTFQRFYNIPIYPSFNFGNAVLSAGSINTCGDSKT